MTQLIDLGKLRFHFAGDWSQSTVYESNDVIKYGGNVYVYTYALKLAGTLPTDTSHWALMVEGFKFQGVFDTATAYRIGDGIAHGGKIYVSVLDSTNQTPPNATYWSQFVDGIQYEGIYSGVGVYQKNDVVIYGGSTYIAKQDTTANLPTATAYWDKFIEGISPKSIYNEATVYVPNDLVVYGPNIYRAKVDTTGNVPSLTAFWEIYVSGTVFQGAYDGATTYYLNDIVSYGSNTYRSKLTQSNVLPTDTSEWELLTTGFSYQGVWSSATAYLIGQVIKYGGSLFQAISDNDNVNPTVTATWTKLVAGYDTKGDWVTATQYGIDEVVAYGGNTYISLVPHASTVFDTDLVAGNWLKFNSGIRFRGAWDVANTYLPDDVVTSGSSTYIAIELVIAGDAPSLGTNVSFALLAAGAEGFVATADIGVTAQAFDADTSKTDVAETRSASINMADNVVQRPEIKDYSETVQAMAANDVDCTLGNVQTKSISTTVTLTFSNPPVSGKAGAFTLIATFSGSPAITWPASVKWAGGTAPTLTAVGIDVFTFMTTDGGTTWYGFTSGADMQ